MKQVYVPTLSIVLMAFIGSSASAQHQEHNKAQPANSMLAIPSALRVEHQHLHQSLAEALAAGGKTAEAAKKVEAVLTPHFAEEEEYAMPPLGLLEVLAQGRQPTEQQVREALKMSDKLRNNYGRMLDEHRRIATALQQLAAAAKAEKKPSQAEFAEALMLHAQNEEQILYPAALLVGDYLKLKAVGTRP
jgi:Tfp pilus assembly protein PilF